MQLLGQIQLKNVDNNLKINMKETLIMWFICDVSYQCCGIEFLNQFV